MRKIIVCGVLLGGLVIAASFPSCKGESEPITSVCKSFCGSLVDAMNDSYYYDISYEGVGGTKTSCGQDCTEVVAEYKKLDIGSMSDCVSCMADKGFNQIGDDGYTRSKEWTFAEMTKDIPGDHFDSDDAWVYGDDCYKDCDQSNIEYHNDDNRLLGRFFDDFLPDFAHHYSVLDEGDLPCWETNDDGDREYHESDDLCCVMGNPCNDLDSNGNCDCKYCTWDDYDCEGGSDVDSDIDIDTDVDSDVDSDADTDTSGACDEDAYLTCTDDYSACASECVDTDCTADCMVDLCDCADAIGCSDYLEGYC
jgi:hypothetical protein